MRLFVKYIADFLHLSVTDFLIGTLLLSFIFFITIILIQKRKHNKRQQKNERLIVANEVAIHEKNNIISNFQADQKKKESEIRDLNKRLAKRDAHIEELKSTIDTNETKIQKLSSSKAYLEKQKEELEHIIHGKETANIFLSSRVEKQESDITLLNEIIGAKKNEVKKLNLLVLVNATESRALQNQIEELNRALDSSSKELHEKEDILSRLSTELLERTDDVSLLNTKNEELNNEIKELKNQLTKQSIEIADFHKQESVFNQQREELEDQIVSLKESKDRLSADVKRMQADLEKQISEQDNKKTRIEYLEKENHRLQEELDRITTREIVTRAPKPSILVDEPISSGSIDESPITVTPAPSITGGVSLGELGDSSEVDTSKRKLDTVIDIENDCEINASRFFSQPEPIIFKVRCDLEKAILLNHPKYVCKYCGQMVRISGRKTERGMARFFSHLRDSDDCDYKTTTGLGKREIERMKFGRGVNEGERHKRLKAEIAHFLSMTGGVSDVQMERHVKGSHPILKWRRPDVSATYRGQSLVFELQLSTTFVSVITERDLFYRLNKTFIIWVFNFEEQQEHVNLSNMMAKDIYYNNRLNVFLFDKDAYNESQSRGELVLKCNWLNPDKTWAHVFQANKDDSPFYVTLRDLTYPDSYKPFFYDAETPFFKAHPQFMRDTERIEDENRKIISDLDKLWDREQRGISFAQEEDSAEGQTIVESTDHYDIVSRDSLLGLVWKDGSIRLPFIYKKINVYEDWCEGVGDGFKDYYNQEFELINNDVKYCEESKIAGLWIYIKEIDGCFYKGIMDSKGSPKTSAIYADITVWSDDCFLARRDGAFGLINTDGDELLWGYSFIGERQTDGTFEVKKDNKTYRIDIHGESVITEQIHLDDETFKIKKGGFWGISDQHGNTIIPCEYDEIGTLGEYDEIGVSKNVFIGIRGDFAKRLNVNTTASIPVTVRYKESLPNRKLIFYVGEKTAFMNTRQQQKARAMNIRPTYEKRLFISCCNEERGLLYLSPKACAVNGFEMGYQFSGEVVNATDNGILIKEITSDKRIYLDRSILDSPPKSYPIGMSILLEKTGFDVENKKHIWKILSSE